jgi:hypothetical protein
MEKEFIPYEQALDLQELGFDEPCLGRWLIITEWEAPTGEIRLQLGIEAECYDKNQCTAPLFQQAFGWLLKEHNLYAIIIPTITMHWTFKTMTVIEGMVEAPPYKHVDAHDYATQEEAELACLKKLIEIVKEK